MIFKVKTRSTALISGLWFDMELFALPQQIYDSALTDSGVCVWNPGWVDYILLSDRINGPMGHTDNSILGKVCCFVSFPVDEDGWFLHLKFNSANISTSPSVLLFFFFLFVLVFPLLSVKWTNTGEISSDSGYCTRPHSQVVYLCVTSGDIAIKLQWAAVIYSCWTSRRGLSIYKIDSLHTSLMVLYLCDCALLPERHNRCWTGIALGVIFQQRSIKVFGADL